MAIFYLYIKTANSILVFDEFDLNFFIFQWENFLLMVYIKMCKVM